MGLTSGKGMLSAFMAFIEPGDEVIVFEPFFDQQVHFRPNLEQEGVLIGQ